MNKDVVTEFDIAGYLFMHSVNVARNCGTSPGSPAPLGFDLRQFTQPN
jgi:hypothetical protein